MKKLSATTLIICFSLFLLPIQAQETAQDTIWYDANWNKSTKNVASYYRPAPAKKSNGYWLVDYYLSGAKQMEALSNAPDSEHFNGVVTWYYENGNVMQTVNYLDNVLNGERKNYHESGPLKSQYSYNKDGKIDGTWVSFYENSKPDEEGQYSNGVRSGMWKEYHKNGKLKGEGRYKDDKKVGTWKMYFYSGIDEDE